MFKEGAVAYFEELQRQTSGGTKEKDKSLSQKLRDPVEDANRQLPELNKVRSITDGGNFVNSGTEENRSKRQELTKV